MITGGRGVAVGVRVGVAVGAGVALGGIGVWVGAAGVGALQPVRVQNSMPTKTQKRNEYCPRTICKRWRGVRAVEELKMLK